MILLKNFPSLFLLLPSFVVYSWVFPSSTKQKATVQHVNHPLLGKAVKDDDVDTSKTITSSNTNINDNDNDDDDDRVLDDVIDKALTQDDNRNVPSLQEWAIQQGIQLADGVELVDNGLGDWGVGSNQNQTEGTPVMTIPRDLILSSEDLEVQTYRKSVVSSMKRVDDDNNNTSNMEFYVPECLLVLRILEEKSKQNSSRWKSWLDTLPKSFNTGLYLDKIERIQVERLAPEFLKQQDLQWKACYTAIQGLLEEGQLPNDVVSFLTTNDIDNDEETCHDTMESMIRWAFSVVFTRSWRTATGLEANLVPLGDMFNHDSLNPNVAPKPYNNSAGDDGTIQLVLKEDTEAGSDLQISYGLSTFPGRFLVLFGFWDRSSLFMDANLTIPDEFTVDRVDLVVSTRNGAMTEDVWNLAAYNILRERDPKTAALLAEAQRNRDDAKMQELASKWDLEIALYLRLHVLKLLSDTYPDMDLVPEDMSGSPRRYGMIARYNNGLRDSWMRVADYLDEEIEDAYNRRQNKVESE